MLRPAQTMFIDVILWRATALKNTLQKKRYALLKPFLEHHDATRHIINYVSCNEILRLSFYFKQADLHLQYGVSDHTT